MLLVKDKPHTCYINHDAMSLCAFEYISSLVFVKLLLAVNILTPYCFRFIGIWGISLELKRKTGRFVVISVMLFYINHDFVLLGVFIFLGLCDIGLVGEFLYFSLLESV